MANLFAIIIVTGVEHKKSEGTAPEKGAGVGGNGAKKNSLYSSGRTDLR